MPKSSIESKYLTNTIDRSIEKFGLFTIAIVFVVGIAGIVFNSTQLSQTNNDLFSYVFYSRNLITVSIGFLAGYLLLGKNKPTKISNGVTMAFLAVTLSLTVEAFHSLLQYIMFLIINFNIESIYTIYAILLSLTAIPIAQLTAAVILAVIIVAFKRKNTESFSNNQKKIIASLISISFTYSVFELLGNTLINELSLMEVLTSMAFSSVNAFIVAYFILNRFDRLNRFYYASLIYAMYVTVTNTAAISYLIIGLSETLFRFFVASVFILLICLSLRIRRMAN